MGLMVAVCQVCAIDLQHNGAAAVIARPDRDLRGVLVAPLASIGEFEMDAANFSKIQNSFRLQFILSNFFMKHQEHGFSLLLCVFSWDANILLNLL